MNQKVEERDTLVESLRQELQETRTSMQAESQKYQALASSRDQMASKLEEQGKFSSRLVEAKDAEIRR